jgi:hypothetical protein
LVPVSVPKPWGQEIWHSGVEKRATSRVALLTPRGLSVEVPLPYVEIALEIARPERQSALVLLKELDPFDVPYYGELYTEIHLQKSLDNETWVTVQVITPNLGTSSSTAQTVTFSLAEDSEIDNPPPLIEANSYIRIGISLDFPPGVATSTGINFTRLDIHNYDLCNII